MWQIQTNIGRFDGPNTYVIKYCYGWCRIKSHSVSDNNCNSMIPNVCYKEWQIMLGLVSVTLSTCGLYLSVEQDI